MTMNKPSKIAVITGGNAGIGFAIAERLLQGHRDEFTIVLACRNLQRAEDARQKLFELAPGANIELVQVDIESVVSTFQACDDIKKRFTRIDLLFCNAGILPNDGLRWGLIAFKIFTDPVNLVERSDTTIQRKGELTQDGLGRCFECNLFGHYMMIRDLEDLLSASGDGRIIWTSSLTSTKDAFSIDDFQGILSDIPYESSKWATDLTSVYLNERLAPRNVRSFTTHPGIVASGIGNLPSWVVSLRTMVHFLCRICGVTTQTITSANGSLSNVYVALAQPVESLDVRERHSSHVTCTGEPFVVVEPIDGYDEGVAKELVEKMERLRVTFAAKEGRATEVSW